MGRKRKTRWRRLSIGEISGNEEDGEEMSGEVGSHLTRSLSSSQNHSPLHKPYSSLNNNSSSNMTKGAASATNTPLHSSTTLLSDSAKTSLIVNGDVASNDSGPTTPSSPTPHSQTMANGNSGGYSGYNNGHHQGNYAHHHHQYESHYDRYHYHKDNYRPPSYYSGGGGGYERGSSERGGYQGHQKDYHGGGYQAGYHGNGYRGGSSNGYHSGGYNRNSTYTNNSSSGNGSSTTGSEGYNNSGGGGGDYHYSHHNGHHPSSRSYGPGRFRRSRSYPASNYYYANGGSGGSGNNCDNIIKPAYNQEEYTKITTPRQDVLFKKGYLSQKKPQSSSVESTSATTTPTASTNGTPDTQSTNGINSDYSEGYENGETDCVIPYDDAYYYGPPEAVFTDPTGQVYYGHCSSNGEYYDAYPVSPMMVAGYPAMYYPMPYPVDWNGVPMSYPMVAVPPQITQHGPHVEEIYDNPPGLQGCEVVPSPSNESQVISSNKSDTISPRDSTSTLTSSSSSTTSSSSSSETESPLSSPTEQTPSPESTKSNKNLTTTTATPATNSNSSSNSSSCLSEEKAKSPAQESSSPKSTSVSTSTPLNEQKDSKGSVHVKKEQKSKSITASTTIAAVDKDNNNLSKSQKKEKPSEISLSSKGQQQQQQANKIKDSSSTTASSSSISSPNCSAPVSPPANVPSSRNSVPPPPTPMTVTTYASAVGNANVHSNSHPLPPPHGGVPLPPHPHHPPHSMNNGQHFQHPGGPVPQPRYIHSHPGPQQMTHHGPPPLPPPPNAYHHHGPPPQHVQHSHPLPPPPQQHPMAAMGGPPPPPYGHMYHPHPPIPGAGFVYGPPLYNGVAPDTVSSSSSPSTCRKKRKKRRREKDKEKDGQDDDDDDDEGQLTDEASSTSTSTSITDCPNATNLSNSTKKSEESKESKPKLVTTIKLEESESKIEKSLPHCNKTSEAITLMQIDTTVKAEEEFVTPTPQPISLKIISRSPSTTSSSSLEERDHASSSNSNSTSPSKQPNKFAVRKEIISEPVEESVVNSGSKSSKSKKKRKSKSKKSKSPPSVSAVLEEMKEKRRDIINAGEKLPVTNTTNTNTVEMEKEKQTLVGSSMTPKDDGDGVASNDNKKCSEEKKSVSDQPCSSSNIDDGAESTEKESSTLASDQNNAKVEMKEDESCPISLKVSAADAADTAQVALFSSQMPTNVLCSNSNVIPQVEVEEVVTKKPSDLDLTLTSQDVPIVATDYDEFLLKETEPEPSSPSDSLNTNQSMAGSEEVAAISVSESDFLNMNRTTSLDEVEEDLPQEEVNQLSPRKESTEQCLYQAQSTSTAPEVSVSLTTVPSTPEQFLTKESAPRGPVMGFLEHEDEAQLSPTVSLSSVDGMQKEKDETLETYPKSEPGLDEQTKQNVTDLGQQVLEQGENCSTEQLEKVTSNLAQLHTTITSEKSESKTCETEARPKSLTLVVSEWLKAQGDGALTLTPIGPGSGEEGDADLSEDDEDEEYEEDFERDVSPLQLQNQKNGHCNPWAASSNKKNNFKDGTISSSRVANHHSSDTTKESINSVNQIAEAIHQNQTTTSNQTLISDSNNKNTNYDSGYELSSPEENQQEQSETSRRKNHRKSLESDVDHYQHQKEKNESVELGQPIHPQQLQSFTSLDESNPTEICDPQKFSKYYQFGVVFDPDQDQGIDSSEIDGHKDRDQDFLQVMMKTNKKLEKKQNQKNIKTFPPNKLAIGKGSEVVLRGYYDQDDDEEIGTFDPDVVAQQKHSRRFFAQFETKSKADDIAPPTDATTSTHIYMNPLSLAKELVESGEPLSESWDVDSEPLPPYEHPPPVDIPVYNNLTPQNRLIRRKLHAVGDPVPSAICCSIQ